MQGIDGLHLGSLVGRIETKNNADDEAEDNRQQYDAAIQNKNDAGAGKRWQGIKFY